MLSVPDKPDQVVRSADPQAEDRQKSRWGRSRFDGEVVGRYQQAPPYFFTADGHPLWIADFYRGRSLFLICGGPSLKSYRLSRLQQPGIMTLGCNNSAAVFRPNLWVEVDSPHNFIKSVWMDPCVLCFAPYDNVDKPVFDSNQWRYTGELVRDCPAVAFYKRNNHFIADQFLYEDTLNWGNHEKHGGGRSVMLPAFRIAFLLGFRRLFLLGVDLDMTPDKKYAFAQDRHDGSLKGNQATHQKLKGRFEQLRPILEAEGVEVFNCNPDSKLKAFDHMPFREAVQLAAAELGVDCEHERTFGLYERGGLQEKVDERTDAGQKALTKAHDVSVKLVKATGKAATQLRHEMIEHAKVAARQFKLAHEKKVELDRLQQWKPKPERTDKDG